jgi:hypothetical protein
MHSRSRAYCLLLLSLLLVAAGGCIFSPDNNGPEDNPPVVDPLPFPDTPDKIMANFKTVYTAMDINRYRDEVLSPNYLFVLQNETVELFGLPDNLFGFEDEVRITGKMFSGQPNEVGKVLSEVEIQVLQPQGAWVAVPNNDPYFGGLNAQVRNYNTLIFFNMQGQFRYEVQGNQLFYVAADTVMHDGVLTPRYRLLGQLDQTTTK